jgi:hypothetical protein
MGKQFKEHSILPVCVEVLERSLNLFSPHQSSITGNSLSDIFPLPITHHQLQSCSQGTTHATLSHDQLDL